MQIKIETLNRDIQIHKEVEKELAKRRHFENRRQVREQQHEVNGIDSLSHVYFGPN